jgi:methyl-accepting chemotaxis protein
MKEVFFVDIPDGPVATKNIQAIIQSILSDTEELLRTTNETNQISKDQKNAVITVSEAMKELEDSVARKIQFDPGRNTIH